MNYLPEHLIDACLTQLNEGMDLEAVLAEHPTEADELRPILAGAAWVRMDIPPPARRLEGKQALMAACAQQRRAVETTQGYVNEIKAGVPLDELLAHAKPEAQPLVVAAWRMHTTAAPAPDAEKFAAGKLALMAMVEQKRAAARSTRPVGERVKIGLAGLWQGLAPRPTALRRAWAGSLGAIATVMVISVGATGVTAAAAASMPGDTFYPVKRLGEHARLWLTLDPTRRADLSAEISAERLAEISHLIDEGREVSAEMLADWLRGQPDALSKIQGLSDVTQARLGANLDELLADGAQLADLAGNPVLANELRQWLDGMARAAEDLRDTADARALPASPAITVRPLSAEDSGAQALPLRPVAQPKAEQRAAPAVVPNPPVPAAAKPQEVPAPQQFQQSGGDYQPVDQRDPKDRESRSGSEEPAGQAGPPPSPTSQQIIQVPMDPEPTETPTPGAGGADPSSPTPEVPDPGSPGAEPEPSVTP